MSKLELSSEGTPTPEEAFLADAEAGLTSFVETAKDNIPFRHALLNEYATGDLDRQLRAITMAEEVHDRWQLDTVQKLDFREQRERVFSARDVVIERKLGAMAKMPDDYPVAVAIYRHVRDKLTAAIEGVSPRLDRTSVTREVLFKIDTTSRKVLGYSASSTMPRLPQV